jgi:hypothetical protein
MRERTFGDRKIRTAAVGPSRSPEYRCRLPESGQSVTGPFDRHGSGPSFAVARVKVRFC